MVNQDIQSVSSVGFSDSDRLLSVHLLPVRSEVVLRQYRIYMSPLTPPHCAMEKEHPKWLLGVIEA